MLVAIQIEKVTPMYDGKYLLQSLIKHTKTKNLNVLSKSTTLETSFQLSIRIVKVSVKLGPCESYYRLSNLTKYDVIMRLLIDNGRDRGLGGAGGHVSPNIFKIIKS